jgi:uncharacterized protein YoxC
MRMLLAWIVLTVANVVLLVLVSRAERSMKRSLAGMREQVEDLKRNTSEFVAEQQRLATRDGSR